MTKISFALLGLHHGQMVTAGPAARRRQLQRELKYGVFMIVL